MAHVLGVCISRDTEAGGDLPLPLPLRRHWMCGLGCIKCRDVDIDVNPSKEKHLTNVRSVTADEKMVMPPPRQMTLEEAIG